MLVACGGSGGGDSTVATPAVPALPVASPETFALKTAYVSLISTSQTKSFKISVSEPYQSVSGSGTVTFGSFSPATLNGKSVLSRLTTYSGSLTGNGQTISLPKSTTVSYFDLNYNLLGESDGATYYVLGNTPPIPEKVKVGDRGFLYSYNLYTGSTKNTLIGTSIISYIVEPDTLTTALVSLVATLKDGVGNTIATSSRVLRVTPSGGVALVKENGLLSDVGFTMTFIYD